MPVFQLSHHLVFPPAGLSRADGLLAVGGDLSEARILLAYQAGIFPWYSEGDPILWWAPDPRLILRLDDFHISRRLGREIRKKTFRVTFDHCFDKVIEACATIRPETWIVPEMIEAYSHLHEQGYAHSVECWLDNKLVGGLYGVSLGGVFFGESMFCRVSNSSKIAIAALVERLKEWTFDFIDCQMKTDHLIRMGAREIPGAVFYEMLSTSTQRPTRLGSWADATENRIENP
ncbi:MAG: leucyl/phenylalanyl-tRNA--protein transferase [Thermodesulfobacteriota bacterium]|nr:leucyl/phenylalanyl-tRNA--protein transferase [Thermodesulfobacteriota bacterium]